VSLARPRPEADIRGFACNDIVLENTVPMGEFFVVQPKVTDFKLMGKLG
jgi:hypothetical protein